MKTYLLDQLAQASTWRGIAMLLTAFGINLAPEQTTAIITAGMATSGVIGAFFKD
jgi:hypothetical protein